MMSLSIASPTSVSFTGKLGLSKSSFHGVRIAHICPALAPSASTLRTSSGSSSSASSRVVMMAKKQEELKEIRAKTTEELSEEIVDLKGELFMLRLQRSARNEFKSSEFRRMRKRTILGKNFFLDVQIVQDDGFLISGAQPIACNFQQLECPCWTYLLEYNHASISQIARMLTVKRERELEEGINKRLSRKLDKKWKKSIVPRPPPSLKKLQEEEAAAEAKEAKESA